MFSALRSFASYFLIFSVNFARRSALSFLFHIISLYGLSINSSAFALLGLVTNKNIIIYIYEYDLVKNVCAWSRFSQSSSLFIAFIFHISFEMEKYRAIACRYVVCCVNSHSDIVCKFFYFHFFCASSFFCVFYIFYS